MWVLFSVCFYCICLIEFPHFLMNKAENPGCLMMSCVGEKDLHARCVLSQVSAMLSCKEFTHLCSIEQVPKPQRTGVSFNDHIFSSLSIT